MGGDEFCVLAPVGPRGPEPLVAAATAALAEEGEGFTVTSSYGFVLMPAEAGKPSGVLQLADRRMYERKHSARTSPARQSTDVLVHLLAERHGWLGAHVEDTTELCETMGRELGLPPDQMTTLLQGAALHDIGKAAIPDAILNKPGPLTEDEWTFMRRHPVIGERILSVAPALSGAAKLVRWSHERFDGQGYPDGLAGEQIPLPARIIAVCDAYDAMTSERPYRLAMSAEVALAELRRCAGTQFDPAVVAALCHVAAGDREPAVPLPRQG
jgi:HD-GYP domain-containing protein (c-di-GMP phosphodiesterase class II)